MKGYRCYFMSGGSIQAVQTYECADDVEVILKGSASLESKPDHQAIEIGEGQWAASPEMNLQNKQRGISTGSIASLNEGAQSAGSHMILGHYVLPLTNGQGAIATLHA